MSQITSPAGAATLIALPSTNSVLSKIERTITLPICGFLYGGSSSVKEDGIPLSRVLESKEYALNADGEMTSAMKDYVEMISRLTQQSESVRVSDLSKMLHVKISSATKMVQQLGQLDRLKTKFIFEAVYRRFDAPLQRLP